MLYVCQWDANTLITHDGHVQQGIFHMSMEKFLALAQVPYEESYWVPDCFGKRYQRTNFQAHNKIAGKHNLETS